MELDLLTVPHVTCFSLLFWQDHCTEMCSLFARERVWPHVLTWHPCMTVDVAPCSRGIVLPLMAAAAQVALSSNIEFARRLDGERSRALYLRLQAMESAVRIVASLCLECS